MDRIPDLITLYDLRGSDQYGGEAVSQLAHGLQCAALAECEGAHPALVAAALLHDVGHLLAKQTNQQADDHHEDIGHGYLVRLFGPDVAEPVGLHVAAKRYLCATEAAYFSLLSPASVQSLAVQGGPFSPAEVAEFERNPYAADAVRLRRWDEQAKTPDAPTPTLADFRPLLEGLAVSRP